MGKTEALANAANISEFVEILFGVGTNVAIVLVVVASIWAIVWKGLALWKSSKKDHKIWFVVLLIVNTIGILEILYIYLFSKIKLKDRKRKKKK